MYVCMYACMHGCLYVRMNVCPYACMHVSCAPKLDMREWRKPEPFHPDLLSECAVHPLEKTSAIHSGELLQYAMAGAQKLE
jgi:hypothetical protein